MKTTYAFQEGQQGTGRRENLPYDLDETFEGQLEMHDLSEQSFVSTIIISISNGKDEENEKKPSFYFLLTLK